MDSINSCIKQSPLYINGTIKPRFLTINERVRQFGGHKTYARFLMFMGLGLLCRKKKNLYFTGKKEKFINLPRQIAGNTIVKDYESNSKRTYLNFLMRY